MVHLVNFFKNKNISQEIIWAVSIIIVCVLAGGFLFMQQLSEKSYIETLSSSEEMILWQENSMDIESSADTSEEPMNSETENIFYVSEEGNTAESIELFVDSENPELESAETFTETENVFSEFAELPEDTLSASDTKIDNIADISYDCPIDFEELWKTNEDVYAWITVPGTVIDYPILQHETDDSYYLNYTIDGIEGYPGCIYTENVNSKDFTDNNTAIYGHNMRNGTMFTDLHKFRDAEFFKEHDTIYIYTPEKQLTYKIFAAYLYDDRHLMNSFDFSNPEVYSDYLLEIQNMDSEDMNIRKEITVSGTDKIITLITCIREQPEKRVYVQAVLQY